jgi:hypothetical protein
MSLNHLSQNWGQVHTFPYDIHHALIIRAWFAGHFDDGVFENLNGDSFAICG